MTLLVLHRDPETGLAALRRSLEERDLDLRHVEVSADGPVGAPAGFEEVAGVLVLGGRPAGRFPAPTADLLRRAVDGEVPVLALGDAAGVLAEALGGEVAPRERPEVGWVALHRTAPGREDDVTAGWPDGSHALALHRDEVVRLPAEAEQLLIGSDGPSLWRLGTAWACPLHLEVEAATVERWLADDDVRALVTDAGGDPDALLEESRRRDRFGVAVGASLVLRWVDGEVLSR